MQYEVRDLGLVDFEEALALQKEVFDTVKSGSLKGAILVCQHYPVITSGRRLDKKNILAPADELRNRGIKICEIERGGDVTYHGPGQLVIYPILNLNYFKKDIHFILSKLEEIAIRLVGEFGVKACRIAGRTGAWVEDRKIASIGIAIKKWITFHGLAINIKSDDLDNFSLIRPCGMDIMMTSLESILGKKVEMAEVKEILKRRLQNDQSCFA